MNHEERMEACRVASDKLLKKYPGDIIATGVSGSVGRCQDLKHSDIDFHVLVKDGSPLKSHMLVVRGCLLSVTVKTEKDWRKELEEPNRSLPLAVGSLESILSIHDSKEIFVRLRNLARNLPDECWRNAVRNGLEDIVEDLGRARNFHAEKDWDNFRTMAVLVALSYAQVYASLRRMTLTSEKDLMSVFKKDLGESSEPARRHRIASCLTNGIDEDILESLEWLHQFLVDQARKQSAAPEDLRSISEYNPP
jgi:hypothetical protein